MHLSDALIIILATAAASLLRFGMNSDGAIGATFEDRLKFIAMSVFIAALWMATLATFRTTDMNIVGVGVGEYRRVVNACTTTFGLAAIVFLIFEADGARWFFFVALPLGVPGLLLSRWLWRKWLIRQRKLGRAAARVVIVGTAPEVMKVMRQLESNPASVYLVVGAVVDDPNARIGGATVRTIPVIHGLENVAEHAERLGADSVIVAGQPGEDGSFVHDLAWKLEGTNVDLVLATSLLNVAGPRIHLRPFDGLPLLHVEIPQFEGGKHVWKRALDILVSAVALVLLSPFFLIITILVKLDSDGPAFFLQERVGRAGETFRIVKFRSMVVTATADLAGLLAQNEGSGPLFKLRKDPRVTRLGHTLRKYSIDELPQLWNVLLGEMSLVGPRPPLLSEVRSYEEHVHRRLYIKPGLTGMWQINGRSMLSWEESVRLDLYYVENWSVIGDLMIMWRTLKVLVQPTGAF